MTEAFKIEVELEVTNTKEFGDSFEATAFLVHERTTLSERLGHTSPNASRDRACAISYALSEMASMLYHGTIKI